MKKILLCSLACLSLSASNAQTWNVVPVTSGNYMACSFATPTTVYAAGYGSGGDSSWLVKSVNSGISFSHLSASFIPSTQIPRGCVFTSADTGCIAGGDYSAPYNNGFIYRTTNGGAAWTSVATHPAATFRDMAFPSRLVGYAVGGTAGISGYSGMIYKTTNGGATWTSIYSSSTACLFKISLINDTTGYAVGINSTGQAKLITIRNGSVLSDSNVSAYSRFTAVHFRSLDTGFVGAIASATSDQCILKTTDAGISWSVVYTATGYYDFHDIGFANAAIGYTVGIGGRAVRTTDGGNTWTAITLPTATAEIKDLEFRNNTGIMVGEGFVMRNGDVTATPLFENPAIPYDLYPNPVAGLLHLSFNEVRDNITIRITDIAGRIVKQGAFTGKDHSIETGDLETGMYLFHITTANGETATSRLLVQ